MILRGKIISMKENILTIHINRPIGEVFKFSLDSSKLPLWFESIAEEIPSEIPAKLGTILKNRGHNSDKWNEYEITEFVPNELFTLSQIGGGYNVSYTYKSINGGTELTYHEWVDDGELDDAVDMKPLELLKKLLENS